MKQETKITIKKLWRSIVVMGIALVAIISLTYAWFSHHKIIATLQEVTPPDNITILGPNAKELERLDLSYTSEDVKKQNVDGVAVRQVTLNRIICVQSTAQSHRLEIVHTTNMKNLTFELHHVTNTNGSTITDGAKTGNAMTVDYETAAISGSYINEDNGQADSSHKYANQSYHQQNYGTYDKVQIHAEPVYWLMDKAYTIPEDQEPEDGLYNTYYVLTISWTEDTKETDVFYVMAKTE